MGDDLKRRVEGMTIDPDMVAAMTMAVKETASKFSYAGISIGSYITDEECREVALAALVAANNYKSARSI